MEKNQLVSLLIIVALLTMGGVMITYFKFIIIDIVEVDAHIKVDDHIGFNVDTDKLWFGAATPGGSSSTRKINISNLHDFPVMISFTSTGDLGKWILLPMPFRLNPGENKEIHLSVIVPEATEYGEYAGKVKAISKRIIRS